MDFRLVNYPPASAEGTIKPIPFGIGSGVYRVLVEVSANEESEEGFDISVTSDIEANNLEAPGDVGDLLGTVSEILRDEEFRGQWNEKHKQEEESN